MSKHYLKIDKRNARNNYNRGIKITIAPCKCSPYSMFATTIASQTEIDFNKLINEFEYYNCNWETGYRTAYFVEY